MKRKWKGIGSLLLAFCMVFTMLPGVALAASDEDAGTPLGMSGDTTPGNVVISSDIADSTASFAGNGKGTNGSLSTLDPLTYGPADGNTLTISSGSFTGDWMWFYGAYTYRPGEDAVNNQVILNGGSFDGDYQSIYGGNSGNYTDGKVHSRNNTVTINDFFGSIATIYGSSGSSAGDATGNKVILNGGSGTIQTVCGGSALDDATGNAVEINADYITVTGNISGGDASLGKATDNTVTISGHANLRDATVRGGYAAFGGDVFTGNTLNLQVSDQEVKGLANFENYNFELQAGVANNDTMITVTNGDGIGNPVDITDTNIGISLAGTLDVSTGDKIVLIDSSTKGLTGTPVNDTITASGYTFALSVESGKLIATVTVGGSVFFDPTTATFNLAYLPAETTSGGVGTTAWEWNYSDRKLFLKGSDRYTLMGKASGRVSISTEGNSAPAYITLKGAEFTCNGTNSAIYLPEGGALAVTEDSKVTGGIITEDHLSIILNNTILETKDDSWSLSLEASGLTISGSGTVKSTAREGAGVNCIGDLTVDTGCTLESSGTRGIEFQEGWSGKAPTISGGGNIIATGTFVSGIQGNIFTYSLTFAFTGELDITGETHGLYMWREPTPTAITFTKAPAKLTINSKNGILGCASGGTVILQNMAKIPGLTEAFNAGATTFTAIRSGNVNPGSGSSGGSTTTPTTPTVPETKAGEAVTAVVPVGATGGANGTASASISDKAIADAIAAAEKAAKDREKTEDGIAVALDITMPQGATGLTTTLTQDSLTSLVNAGVNRLELNGGPVSLGLDMKALQEIQKQIGGNVNISITPATGLSAGAQALIGGRPVFNITISGTKSGQGLGVSDLGNGTATISIPYTPASNEVTTYLFGVYVDEGGNVQQIPNSFYDPDSKSMVIPTDHFSVYGVGYGVPLQFTDISKHWAKASIEYVAGKGLVSGTTETTFSPNAAMTRGMLVTILGRLAKVDVEEYKDSSFTDVSENKYYAPYIEWAYKKGIIQGMGDGSFAPDKAITREQIAVIFANYAKATGYTLPADKEATAYADGDRIGSSYKAAVEAMQQAGIMTGDADNQFNPKAGATRAEVSSMLHRYMEPSH